MAKHYSEFKHNPDNGSDDELRRLINECNIYQVHPSNGEMYYICKGDGINDSHFSSKNDTHTFVGKMLKDLQKPIITIDEFYKLCNNIRNKTAVVYRGSGAKETELNIMSGKIDENWITPVYDPQCEDPHPFFQALMQSISGNDPEMQKHIERCILVKRFNPYKYDIPVIVFTGSGGVGKQWFAEVLRVLFGGSFIKGSTTDLFSKKNPDIIGKAIVFGNELKVDGRNYDNVKSFVWENCIRVNIPKCGTVEADNVSWCILASNHIDNPVPITGEGEDRRWTINRNTSGYSLPDYVADLQIYKDVADDYDNAEDFMKRDEHFVSITQNPHYIAIWLGYLIRKHGYPLRGQSINNYKTAEFYRLVDLHKREIGIVNYEFENRILFAVLQTTYIKYFTTESIIGFYKDCGGVNLATAKNKDFVNFLKSYIQDNNLSWEFRLSAPQGWHRNGLTKEQHRSMVDLSHTGEEWTFSLEELEKDIIKPKPEEQINEVRKVYVYSSAEIEEMSADENEQAFIDPLPKDEDGDYNLEDYIPRIEGTTLFASTPEDVDKLLKKDPAKWRTRFGVPVFRINSTIDNIENNIEDYYKICDGLYIRKVDVPKVSS